MATLRRREVGKGRCPRDGEATRGVRRAKGIFTYSKKLKLFTLPLREGYGILQEIYNGVIVGERTMALYKNHMKEKLTEEQFQNPTSEYRGAPFWAWNNKLDRDQLLRQIEYFKEMGMGRCV